MNVKTMALVAGLAVGTACGGGGGSPAAAPTPAPLPTPVSIGPVDPGLVGRWVGPMNGTFGNAEMTLVLNADGTATSEGNRPEYCRAVGNWGVSGGEFTTLAIACDGTQVNMVAPASSAALTGRWFTLPNPSQGQFSVTRQ